MGSEVRGWGVGGDLPREDKNEIVSWFRVHKSVFRVEALGFIGYVLACKVLGLRVSGLGFRVQGLGFRV